MNDHPEARDGDTATAEGKLHQLNLQVTAMRAVLVQLLQEVVQAEKRLDNNQATRLLQANEQLVIRSLEHQAAMDPYIAKQQSAGSVAFCTHSADDQAVASDALASGAHEQIIAEHERRHAQLVEANEKLVLAALGFEALRDAASDARQLRDDLLGAVVKELDDPGAPVRLAAALSGLGTAHEALLPQAVKMVERQMEHMARTVATLLEPLQGAPLNLPGAQVVEMRALARAAVEACRALIASRRQVLDLHLEGQPVGVHGHPLQLAQLLTRLLRNATDFTPLGGRISLHVQPLGPNVQLVVSDSGLGIERDALSTVLDPFVRDPRLRWDSGDSSGFGLTGVRAVVEAHGGSVAASSAGAGKGCQFTVLLPRVSLPTPG